MRLPAPQAPGWYPDRQDSARVRYWDGREWTSRLRPMPVWLPDPPDFGHPPGLGHPPDLGHLPDLAVEPAARYRAGPRRPSQRVGRRRRRLREALGAGVVVVLVAVLTVGTVLTGRGRELVGTTRARATPTITDPRYVRQADATCLTAAAVQPGSGSRTSRYHPAAAPTTGGGGRAVVARAAKVRTAAIRAAAIRDGLDALAAPPGDDGVSAWLEGWDTLVQASRRYASALDGTGRSTTGLAAAYRRARSQVDGFARVNGLDHCQV